MRSLQARGRPQEAAREVRALLELMRENETAVQRIAATYAGVLGVAIKTLNVLDLEAGDKELIQAVKVQLVQLAKWKQLMAGVA